MQYTKEKLEALQKRWTTPHGKKLIKIIKDSHCYLSPVLFREKIKNLPMLKDREVMNGIDLRGAPLSGFDFRVTVQEDDEGFSEEIAIFSNIHFEGAHLRHCNFENGKIHNCYFENSDLSHSELNNTTFNTCHFGEADLSGADFRGTKLINCNFIDANIKDIALNSTTVDQKTVFSKILKSEKENNLEFAAIEYKQLCELYKNSSLHGTSDYFHYRKMVAKRKALDIKNPYRFLSYVFGDLLSRYGTSYISILCWIAIIVLACATIYHITESVFFHNGLFQASFSDSLYFSLITFTTLGYGDYHPVGILRFVAGLESLTGMTLIALFTVIVARKIIRD